jgi:site-specific recombinase XerD
MNNAMTISFQLKTGKANQQGKAPIYCRITIGGRRTEFSTKRTVDPKRWIAKAGVVKGTTEESRSLNAFLDTVRRQLNEHYRLLLGAGKPLTPEAIKNAYCGITERGKNILEVFRYHNEQVARLVGKDYSAGTLERYKTALSHTQDFIQWKYHQSDLEVGLIDHQFLTEFEFYLKTERQCSHNTALKYITNLKKIIRICLANGWLQKDPFTNFKIRLHDVAVDFLTEEELQVVAEKNFVSQRLEQVRDIFLMCCYTGLAYADIKKLSKDHVVIGIDGGKWIIINRTKTGAPARIPLLPIAADIIDKYAQHPRCLAEGRLLPVLSNQKMNAYLKEIADVCGVNKKFRNHLARHTFATTVTLTHGVSMESISKMLGHKSTRMTQHYAKVVDRKLSEEMYLLKAKMEAKKPQQMAS